VANPALVVVDAGGNYVGPLYSTTGCGPIYCGSYNTYMYTVMSDATAGLYALPLFPVPPAGNPTLRLASGPSDNAPNYGNSNPATLRPASIDVARATIFWTQANCSGRPYADVPIALFNLWINTAMGSATAATHYVIVPGQTPVSGVSYQSYAVGSYSAGGFACTSTTGTIAAAYSLQAITPAFLFPLTIQYR